MVGQWMQDVRIALGAQKGAVRSVVLRQGFKLASVGILIGLSGALCATRVLQSLLMGVSPTDPTTFLLITAFLGFMVLLACWLPARRAVSLDPIVVLRHE